MKYGPVEGTGSTPHMLIFCAAMRGPDVAVVAVGTALSAGLIFEMSEPPTIYRRSMVIDGIRGERRLIFRTFYMKGRCLFTATAASQ